MSEQSQVKVNDNNKIDYLNKLVQYRLIATVSEKIQHFHKCLYVICVSINNKDN